MHFEISKSIYLGKIIKQLIWVSCWGNSSNISLASQGIEISENTVSSVVFCFFLKAKFILCECINIIWKTLLYVVLEEFLHFLVWQILTLALYSTDYLKFIKLEFGLRGCVGTGEIVNLLNILYQDDFFKLFFKAIYRCDIC